MHRKTNLQTTVISLNNAEYFRTFFSTECLRNDGHQNSKAHSSLQSKSIDYPHPHIINSNYPPVKSKTTHIIDNSPILYRTSELITSNLKFQNWFNKPVVNNDRLFGDQQSFINSGDNQYQHLGICCVHIIGFVAVIILLSQYFGIRIVEKSKISIESSRTIFDVLVDPVNIAVVFEFDYFDEYVRHKKRSAKLIRKVSTVIDINDSGWESVGIHQSFRDKSGSKRDDYLKKRKCASVGPVLVEMEWPPRLNRYDTKVIKSDDFDDYDNNGNSVENNLIRKESDGNSTSGSYTTSYVCVIFIFIYFICNELQVF